MNPTSNKGEAALWLLAALAFAAGWVTLPDWFNKDKDRAEQSEETTEQLVAAYENQGGGAAASVVSIGVANDMAPESPSKAFISREVPQALSLLPNARADALIEAERRRVAVMEGRVEQANALYAEARGESARLKQDLEKALREKRESDAALMEAAVAKAAAEKQTRIFMLVAGLLVVLVLWVKLTGVGPATLGKIAADVRQGAHPIAALDSYVPEWLKSSVRKQAKLEMEIKDL